MTYQRLTSVDNPLLKMIRRAAAGSGRASRQMIAAEGIRVLEEGTASVCEIEAAVISEQFGADPREKTLLEAWESKGIRICVVNDALFKSISAVQTHQGAVALFNVPERTIADALPENGSLIPLMLIA
ncbi:MAG TPA: RNA methyltransferase substrate-binding domain-containing protein, partial [Acidobacteriota bacterium]|nr:RNA methyltransferase substrate-binding domain-containing protein [Acidobacteriota bacterium]